jgi:hypothetical protein
MRPVACAIALLLLNSAIFAQSNAEARTAQDTEHQTGYCPQTHDLGVEPREEHWFEGTIGNNSVRMYLNRGGAGVVGLFYAADGDWTPTFLGGEWSANGITLSAEAADQAPKGHLQGQLVKGAFIGNWTADSSDHADPVRLGATQEPSCDGRGVWKRFDDPKSPVPFSYPASWHIKEDSGALQLICPDPEAMAYGNEVTIYEGKGEPVGPSEVVHSAKGWIPGNDGGVEGPISVTQVSQDNGKGKTTLSIDIGAWRVYCSDGGYVGLGEAEDRAVVLRDHWIEFVGGGSAGDIVDRLAKSARANKKHSAD